MEIDQRNVVEAPASNPVIPELGDEGVVMVAAPDTTVHTPVPTTGAFPAKVAVDVLHKVWSVPATDIVAGVAILIVTSSELFPHVPFVMVHLKVALAPTVIPVTVDVGLDGVVMVAVPDVTLHAPVPVAATLPARVVLVTLHKF